MDPVMAAQCTDQFQECVITEGSLVQLKATQPVSCSLDSSMLPFLECSTVQNASTKEHSNATHVGAIKGNKNKDQLVPWHVLDVKPQQTHVPESANASGLTPSVGIKGNARVGPTKATPTTGGNREVESTAVVLGKGKILCKSASKNVTLCEPAGKNVTLCEPAGKNVTLCESVNESDSDLDQMNDLEQICSIFQKELEKLGSGKIQTLQDDLKPTNKTAGSRRKKKKGKKKKGHHN